MGDDILRSGYTIQVIRKGAEYVASIPELCIAESGATPHDALSAVLLSEAEVQKDMENRDMSLPPAGNMIDPLPKVTRFVRKYAPFVAKIVVGYVLVLCITAAIAAVVYPSIRLRADQYFGSNKAAVDFGRLFSRLGIAVCSPNP